MTFRKKSKDVFALGLSNFGTSIIFGLFWMYLATLLPKTEYGELGFFMSIANVAFAISFLGLGVTIVIYEPKNHNVFPAAFVLSLISSGLASVIVYVLYQNVPLSILVFGMTIFFILTSGLNGKKRYRDYSIHVMIRAAASVALSLIFYQYLGMNGILVGYFVASLIVLWELAGLMKNRKIDFSILKPKVGFMANMWAKRMSGVMFWWGDKLVIGTLFGYSLLASYQFASQYLILLDAIPRTISQYLMPQEAEGLKNKKIKILAVTFAFIVAIVSIIFIPFGIKSFLPQYEESILPIQIMSGGIIPLVISGIQTSQFLGNEKGLVVLIGNISESGLYLILIIILGQFYGIVGFAIGFLVATTMRAIFNLMMSKRMRSTINTC